MQATTPTPETHSPQEMIHWPSVWQFALSLFGILALWALSAAMLLAVLSSALSGDTVGALALLLNAAGLAFAGVLLTPSAGYAFLRLLGKPALFQLRLQRPGWVILALPPVLLLGHWAANAGTGAYVFLPLMHVLAAAISVAWLLALGLRGLSLKSAQLSWGVFGAGLIGAPLLSLIAELAVLFLLVVVGVVFLMREPQMFAALQQFPETIPTETPEAAVELLRPYVLRPGMLYLIMAFGALLVPLLEELFKPIGVWLLIRRRPAAAQGFAAGLLSGAGYALFENFVLGASAGEDWATVVIARMGTSLIHVLTAGLMGWALVLAWRERRYLRLVGTYFLAIAIHGTWNGTVILTALLELFPGEPDLPLAFQAWGAAAPVIFTAVILGCLLLLVGSNITLNRVPAGNDIIPPAQPAAERQNEPEKETSYDGNYSQSD